MRYLTTANASLVGRTGAGVRVALIDSGVASGHPHVGAVAAGVALVGEAPHDTADRLGHGTAVAAAIRENAPGATLIPVRVLDTSLATTARILASAIEWAVEAGAQLINLSLGTTNVSYIPRFAEALARASTRGVLVVSAQAHEGNRLYPGSLPGAVGVRAESSVPRDGVAIASEPLGATPTVLASPLPRPIPGVPTERNLSGVSFAVANATGMLALALEAGAPPGDAEAMLGWIARHALPDEEGSA